MTATTTETLTEVDVFARDLSLGDVITRVRGTNIPVRWHVLSDPDACHHGPTHISVMVAMDGEYGDQRTVLHMADDLITVASPARRFTNRKASAR